MPQSELFPDTIYLPDRVALAINCLTLCLDSEKSYLPYCLINLTGKPPRMRHTQFDYSDHTARVIDALFLAREMTGTEEGEEQLGKLLNLFRQGFGEDGLHYTPENPWTFKHANMHYQRSVLNALLSWYLQQNSPEAGDRIQLLLEGLKNAAVKREDFWYFPAVERYPDGWPRGDWSILGWGIDPANTNGRLLFGLTRAYEEFGNTHALDLATFFARHVMNHSSAFLSDGSFATGMEFREGHFHSRAVTMLGVIRYGYGVHDTQAIEWGKRVYHHAQRYGSTFGWFPERLVSSRAHGCETCAIVDMMEASIYLAHSGYPGFWEDAERYLRNHLLESQLTSIDWLEPATSYSMEENEWETIENVPARSLGGFAGWSQPNDLVSKVMHNWDLYMCCCAQGVRGLFNAWTHAVTLLPNQISVNLLINHWSPDATVRSWLPHEGHIQIMLRRSAEVVVRIPPWVDRSTLSVLVNGNSTVYRLTDHFVHINLLPHDTTVDVEFSVPELITEEKILDTAYTIHWRGNAITGLSPPGTYFPLYQREHLRNPQVSMENKKVTSARFSL